MIRGCYGEQKEDIMKQIIGYLVKKNDKVIGATGDEREAMYIARNFRGISYKVVTTISPTDDPVAKHTIAYDGTI